jgi:hypothetical protein
MKADERRSGSYFRLKFIHEKEEALQNFFAPLSFGKESVKSRNTISLSERSFLLISLAVGEKRLRMNCFML